MCNVIILFVYLCAVWQSAYEMSNTRPYDGMASSSYSDVGSSDYPFTMQQYPATTTDYQSVSDLDDPMSNSWIADEQEISPGRPQQQQPAVPDAVINMAAKAGSDKKPFAYIADVNDIRQQRDRVRRRYDTIDSEIGTDVTSYNSAPPPRSD